jgi:hypothetical protein
MVAHGLFEVLLAFDQQPQPDQRTLLTLLGDVRIGIATISAHVYFGLGGLNCLQTKIFSELLGLVQVSDREMDVVKCSDTHLRLPQSLPEICVEIGHIALLLPMLWLRDQTDVEDATYLQDGLLITALVIRTPANSLCRPRTYGQE